MSFSGWLGILVLESYPNKEPILAITHCIAHALRRDGISSPVQLQEAAETLTVDGILDELLRDLKHAYLGKAGKQFGRFSEDHSEALVGQWLSQCLDDKMSFSSFATKAAKHLQDLLQDSETVIDGYLLIALEKLADSESAYLFFIQPNEAVWLDANLQVQRSRILDVRGVTAAAKIELTDWQEGHSESYLSVLKARGDKDFTDCFWRWIGFADARDIAGETKVFLEAVTDYSSQLEPEQAQVCRNRVVDYCLEQDKKGAPVVIRELSEHIAEQLESPNPEGFLQYVKQKNDAPQEDLLPERRQLKQFVRISGRNDHVSMSFAAECLGESIVYNKDSDSLTISNLPSPLKMRMVEYLKNSEQK